MADEFKRFNPADANDRKRLFIYLSHGDDLHREWLEEAIEAFFRGLPRPPAKGKGVLSTDE